MKKNELINLFTPEGEALSKDIPPHNVYPRPLLARNSFFCLNGEWNFSTEENIDHTEKILVPFPPESILSGIGRHMRQGKKLFYKRSFSLPSDFSGKNDRILLHIGAADQYASVSLNGKKIGEHEGGYESFSFDITEHIESENLLEITVIDELDKRILPYGKQREKRGGMWYTPFSGIWQTVWLESVPKSYITRLSFDCNTEQATITFETNDGKADGQIFFEGEELPIKSGRAVIKPKEPHLWSPDDPHLYHFEAKIGEDRIRSYFALRSFDIRTVEGLPRICLNGKPYFLHGILDQGYYSDGISTPASLICYENDIKLMKSLGFNTLRKHIKAEPEQFYYDCDRLGMIVMQDMINNGSYSFFRDTALPTVGLKNLPDKFLHPNKKARAAFEKCAIELITRMKNHPSVCYFTIFNEGWGQFESEKMYKKIKALTPCHIIDTASGWFRGAESDVVSPHVYFKPFKMKAAEKPTVLSEFGGYSYSIKGHSSSAGKPYGYRLFDSSEALECGITELYEKEIIPAVKSGLCGAILTQLSDVEDETNGLVTYDRRVIKVTPERMREIAKKIFSEL